MIRIQKVTILVRKKLTLFTLMWMASWLGYSAGNNAGSNNRNDTNNNSLNRLQKNLEELPMQEFRLKFFTLEDNLEKANQALAKKNEKIESLEKRIHELDLQSTKYNLVLKSYKKDLKRELETTDQMIQKDLEFFQIQANKDHQLIQELQEQLKKKEKEFLQYNKELVEIRERLKSLAEKLQSFENNRQLQRVLFVLDRILSSKILRPIKR